MFSYTKSPHEYKNTVLGCLVVSSRGLILILNLMLLSLLILFVVKGCVCCPNF
ncbi:hypothetical protein HanHA89_Chr17g0696451 [Helianthus annuus]|nr:hypothetical protein HanHA89_Chr17g0696451 [Helianthus annuus]